MKKTIILLCLLVSTIFYTSAQTRIGVYTYGVLPENYNTLLGDNLVEAFTESNQYIAVNRSASLFQMLQKARSIQEKGHIDQSQVLSTSKEYGETQICAVDVIEIDYMYVFRATLLDATTNEVLKTASAEVAKSEIGYTKILEIVQKLSVRLVPGTRQNDSDLNSLKATSDVELARRRVEENRMYDISYATFQNNTKKYREECTATNYYLNKANSLNSTGTLLFCLMVPPVGLAAGLGIGLTADNLETGQKIGIIAGIVTAAMIPGIVCWSVAPSCKKKAWKAYREPYDNAIKDLESARKYRQRASLEIAPAVSYDWAGVSLKFKFN